MPLPAYLSVEVKNNYLKNLTRIGEMSKGYFVTTIINQAIPFFLLPVFTRYLNPDEYGSLSLFSFYLLLANGMVGVSTTHVISKHFFSKEKDYVSKLIGACIGVVLMLTIGLTAIVAVVGVMIPNFLILPLLWLLVVPLTSCGWVIMSIGLTVMRNRSHFFAVSATLAYSISLF